MATNTNKQTTDRETAFQAATDNVWFSISWAASQQKSEWFTRNDKVRDARLDYVVNLEMQMELALGRKDLGYSLDI